VWNGDANPDLPIPQSRLRALLCERGPYRPDEVLARALNEDYE
jgi:hypothetical protein